MEYTLDIPDTLTQKFRSLGYSDPLEGLQDAAKLLLGLGPDAWATITRASSEQQTTPAKYILSRLQPAEQTPAPTTKRPNPSLIERDAAIVREYAAGGTTHALLAVKYGLSAIRITQILTKDRAQRTLNAPTQPAI